VYTVGEFDVAGGAPTPDDIAGQQADAQVGEPPTIVITWPLLPFGKSVTHPELVVVRSSFAIIIS
jgi:hypothetical protein